MSVEYKSALIYGYDCTQIRHLLTYEDIEELENIGWSVIYDPYSDDGFLYIGVAISITDCYSEAQVNCFENLAQSEDDSVRLRLKTPDKYLQLFVDCHISLYHLCYAT